ncbi:endo-alpha-N-acetylgalactosaminidase family protein [Paenibacillus sp. GCM10027628]|uniref:endo-alpha-N-acetylgalactosaminidase family protein n=1 Tax=Paenibacillus sp. GCM10027628 TaxID=3273413 RepID=UPI0036421017
MKTKRTRKLVSLLTTGFMFTQIMGIPALFTGTGTVYAASATIQSAKMQVTIDDQFPRVIQYQWLSSGKVMYGQEDTLTTVNINGVSYTPTVSFVSNGTDTATYMLSFPSINVVMTVVIDVVDNVLEFKVTNIIENGSTLVQTIEFPNHSLVSIRDTQAGAQETAVGVKSWNGSTEEYNLLSNKATDAAPVAKSYVILNTNDLAASMYSNAFELLTDSQKNDPHYHDYEKHYYYQTVSKTGYKKLGAWSYPWDYREISGNIQEKIELPYVKVAITDDANGDGTVDWQDGGIAYRQIMMLPKGNDLVPKTLSEIAYTRASLAQWPFLRTLDMIKKIYMYTDGFGQLLEYKGHQGEGHDSGHPDYGININPRAGGIDDLKTLVNGASQYNTYVGVHLNDTEMYPEAHYFDYNKIFPATCWGSMDQSQCIQQYNDAFDNGPTGLAARLKELHDNVPNLSWIYMDVYTGQGYNQWKLAHELNANGWAIGTEMSGGLDRYSIWNHVQENESKVERFLKNSITDEFMFDPILLGARHAGAMGYGNDTNEDQSTTGQTINDQINIFFTQNLVDKYMQNFDIMKMTVDPTLNQTTNVTFKNGLTGQVVDPGIVTNDGTYVTNNPKVELRKNGVLLATYQKQFKKKIISPSAADYHPKYVTPQLTQYLLPWDPQNESKLYHWNSVGGNTTWTLPASWAGVPTVDLYQLTDTGKTLVANLPVTSGQITINAVANTPYVVYKGGQSDAITPVSAMNFGSGGFVKDPGFDSRMLNNWNITSTSGSTSHVTIQTNQAGDAYLQVKGNNGADATISQSITGLTPGKTYQASVWAEVKNGQTVTIGVKDYGAAEVTNTMTKSNVPNKYDTQLRAVINSNNLGTNNMQRLKVNFTVPAGCSSATLYMATGQVAGSQTAEVDLDDVRVAELTSPAPQGNHYFFEDFESNQEGLGPFVPINAGHTHISDVHAGYTNDTINGHSSLKILADTVQEGVRTIPINLKLLPNTTYTVSFPYSMTVANTFKFAVTSGYGTGMVDLFNDTLDNSKYFYSKTFTTGSADDYSFRFIQNGSKSQLIVDDFTVDLGTVAPPAETADQTFDNGQVGGWIDAYGDGQVQAVSQQLSLNTDRYETVALDQNTPDIADGEMTFTVTPQSGNLAGAIIRYTSPTSYTRIGYDGTVNGWRYWDPQGNTGIINMPGVALTTGIPHKVKLTYTGTHYTLYVDNILSYDGDIPALKTTAGRTGFSVRNKSNVFFDKVTFKNLGASSGSTPITPTPSNPQSTPGKIVLDTYDDAYVRDGASATANFGTDPSLVVKWDTNAGYSRESYLKFDLSGVTSSVYAAQIKLNAITKGSVAPNQVVELVSDNTWSENTINWNNKPASSTVIATFTPVLGVNAIDVTSQVQNALVSGKKLSVRIHSASQLGGSSDVSYGAYENTTAGNRPVLELTVPTTSTHTASEDSYVRDGSYAGQNFGTSATLDVKADAIGFSREAYVKYDLTSVTGNVTSAKIQLNLTTAGASAPNQVVELVSDNTWTENGITWSNKPASSGIVLATFAPTVGVHEIDVTSQVAAAMANGKKLSIRVYASQTVGGASSASYGSRENTTSSNRPILTVTTQ